MPTSIIINTFKFINALAGFDDNVDFIKIFF